VADLARPARNRKPWNMISLLCPDEQRNEDLNGMKGVFDADSFLTFISNPDECNSVLAAAL